MVKRILDTTNPGTGRVFDDSLDAGLHTTPAPATAFVLSDWLKDQKAARIVIIEANYIPAAGGAEQTRYLSTGTYVTGAADTPAHQAYLAMAVQSISMTSSISLSGSASAASGDIEVLNPNGELDGWFNDVWTNCPVRAWIGDPRWPRAQFIQILDGVVADIASKSRDRINLVLRDKMQRLNAALSESKLGGTTANKDSALPILIGEAHNLTPLLTNPATLEYQWSDVGGQELGEVRDNGIPLGNLAASSTLTGKFRLGAAPAGAITVSARSDAPVNCTVAKQIQRIVKNYGKTTSDRFTDADLDLVQLASFDASHQQPIGMVVTDRVNVFNAIQQLANSLGAQAVMTPTGKLRLLQINFTSLVSTFDIYDYQMVERNLAIKSREPVQAAVTLGFNKNWTLQAGLQTRIPAEHKTLFDQEWLTTTKVDTAVQATYRLSAEPVQEDTCLLRLVDADPEAQRRLNIRKVPRTTYEFDGYAEMQQLELGQGVTLHHPRFGLSAGKLGMVVSLSLQWATGRVKVGVMV